MVQLTPAGRKALSLAERAQEAIEDDVLQALDDEERATLWRLLTRALHGARAAPRTSAYSATTASISTWAPFGSCATPTVTRAGGSSPEERPIHLVDLREVGQVGHVDGHPHSARQRGAGGLAHRLQVLQAAARLLGRASRPTSSPRRGVERDLTRAEQQLAGAHSVAVGTDRRPARRAACDDLALAGHRIEPTAYAATGVDAQPHAANMSVA